MTSDEATKEQNDEEESPSKQLKRSPQKRDSKSSSTSRKRHKHKHPSHKQRHSKVIQLPKDEFPSDMQKIVTKDPKPQPFPPSPHRTRQQTLRQRSKNEEPQEAESQGADDTCASQAEDDITKKTDGLEVTDSKAHHESDYRESGSDAPVLQPPNHQQSTASTDTPTPATSKPSPSSPQSTLVDRNIINGNESNKNSPNEDDIHLGASNPSMNSTGVTSGGKSDEEKSQERERNEQTQGDEEDHGPPNPIAIEADGSGDDAVDDKNEADAVNVECGPIDEQKHHQAYESDEAHKNNDGDADDDVFINCNVEHLIRLETSRQLEAAWSAQRRLIGAFVTKVRRVKVESEQQ